MMNSRCSRFDLLCSFLVIYILLFCAFVRDETVRLSFIPMEVPKNVLIGSSFVYNGPHLIFCDVVF